MKALPVTLFCLTILIMTVVITAQPTHHDPSTPALAGGKSVEQKELQQKQQMEENFKSQDAKLQALTTKMNTSVGSEKIEAMAAVINELVAERISLRHSMAEMKPGMMQGKMGMMGQKQDEKPMCMCSMMQKHEGAKPSDKPTKPDTTPHTHH